MEILKIQNEILKKVIKGNGNAIGMIYGKWDDEHIAIIPDGHYITIIPIHSFFLDVKAIWKDNTPFKCDAFIRGESNVSDVIDTHTTKKVDKGEVRILTTPDNNECWVDEKILKFFDKSATFKGINYKSPVYVYENEVLVGVVLPVSH